MDRFGPTLCCVCFGGECRGGGNRGCAQRDPHPSVLAGILDTWGGLRFVVTHRNLVYKHARHDETVVVVPRLKVHEPIAWGDIPFVVARIEHTIREWIKAHSIPNESHVREAVVMYQLRCLEQDQRSFDPGVIAET